MPYIEIARFFYRGLPIPQKIKKSIKAVINGLVYYENLIIPETINLSLFDSIDIRRVLFIDEFLPKKNRDAGSVRALNIMNYFINRGYQIEFICDRKEFKWNDKCYKKIVYGYRNANNYLKKNTASFDFIIISRPHIFSKYIGIARAYSPLSKILYDTVDLHWIRLERQSAVLGIDLKKQIEEIKKKELFAIKNADVTLVCTNDENVIVGINMPFTKTSIVPIAYDVLLSKPEKFCKRTGLLFVGNFDHKPNEDAVLYFANEIMPLLLGVDPKMIFYVVGYHVTKSIRMLASPNIKVLGYVDDLTGIFNLARVFVAPIRFGSGIKGKVIQSLSYGLPIVGTDIAVEGINEEFKQCISVANNAEEFSKKVLNIYCKEEEWFRRSNISLEKVGKYYSQNVVDEAMNFACSLVR